MNQFPQAYREPVDAYPGGAGALLPAGFMHPGLSFSQLTAITWAYRRLSALLVVMVLALTAGVLLVWPRTYTATATLMVNYQVNDPLNGKDLPEGQVSSFIATQVELMRTPGVVLAVVDRLDLTQDATYVRGYRSGSASLREWVADQLSRKLAIYPSQIGSQLIYVSFSARNPALAALVANTVATIYQEQQKSRAAGPPGERAIQNAHQLEELKAKVELAQVRLSGFLEHRGVVDDGAKAGIDATMLSDLEGRLMEAQNARRLAAARSQQDAASSDQVMASSEVQAIRSQLATQQVQLAQLERVDGPENPRLREARLQVSDLRHALATATQGYAANAQSALAIAERQERELSAAVAAQRASTVRQARLRNEAAAYQLEFDSAQEAYKRALDGSDQVVFAAARGPYTNVDVVSPALPPLTPTAPRLLKGALLGFLVAGMLGLGTPLAVELYRRRVRCRDDLERRFGIPVLVEFGAVARPQT